MAIGDLIKGSNVQKFGLFFWVMLSGIAVFIASISHGSIYRYGGLGFILLIGGATGYCISELMDRISSKFYDANPPFWFHILNIILRVGIFIAIFYAIQHYYNFLPPGSYNKRY